MLKRDHRPPIPPRKPQTMLPWKSISKPQMMLPCRTSEKGKKLVIIGEKLTPRGWMSVICLNNCMKRNKQTGGKKNPTKYIFWFRTAVRWDCISLCAQGCFQGYGRSDGNPSKEALAALIGSSGRKKCSSYWVVFFQWSVAASYKNQCVAVIT